MDDIYHEYGCAYVFYYHMILKMKEQRRFDVNHLENIKNEIENYTKRKDE